MEEIQKLLATYEILQAQSREVNSQIELVGNQMNEWKIVKDSLENIEKQKAGTEILMPLGGGVLGFGTLKSTDKVMLNIGANVFAEKKIEDAQKFVAEELKIIEETLEKLRTTAEQIPLELERIEPQLQKMLAASQQEKKK